MASDDMSRDPQEEALRRLLEEAFGGALPPEALEGMDLGELARQANLPTDPNQLRAAAAQMQHLFAQGGDGPVNWKLAGDLARQTAMGVQRLPGQEAPAGSPGDPTPSPEQVRALREASQIASLWLGAVMDFDVPAQELDVWGRATWVHRTLPRWQSTVEPVAKYMAGAIGDAITAQMQGSGMALPGDPAQMMERMGGTLFGIQFGQAIGSLAREVAGGSDLSLPLGPEGRPALVAANVEDFIAAQSLDPAAARIFLASRELAHTALFTAAPWLGRTLFAAIEDYARGITLDLDALDEMVRGLDLSDPESLQAHRPEDLFVFTRRAAQERALEELATTLALVEAWVDHVTTRALTGKLPQVEAMREVLRRRRASGSPAEGMLARTVGIELRPRRVREALAWWESVLATEGEAGREAHWAHPDLLPGVDVLAGTPQAPRPAEAATADLADAALPEDFDAELEKLLSGEDGDAPQQDEPGDERP
ncbi:zinc-dependent metalloprotease [Brachybacterium hainanense]|uniref:Zinc-dependent metalloprotease n=1 Tax=Brachybacterium hainanense TaxID=1541174 RepID=A0ABV6RFG6_9MICO